MGWQAVTDAATAACKSSACTWKDVQKLVEAIDRLSDAVMRRDEQARA